MNKVRVLLFFGLLGIVIAIARCNSQPNSRAQSPIFPNASPVASIAAAPAVGTPSPAATAASSVAPAAPSIDLQAIAARVAPAAVSVSFFDPSGKLVRTTSGCFISGDGRLVTSGAAAHTAANAVAKASDGRIYNIAGVLADAAPLDLAVLKVETKNPLPFVAPNKTALPDVGSRVIVLASPVSRRKPPQVETSVAARRTEGTNEWLEVAPALPDDLLGSPVIDKKGDFLGIVTTAGKPGAPNVIRGSAGVEAAVALIDPRGTAGWAAASAPSPPAAGPTKPPVRFAKIPLVEADRPGSSKLLYTPKPTYPATAPNSPSPPLQGNGRYRITFDERGQVKNVEMLQSTRNATLDGAAMQTLRKWKASPGQEWSATVPITFQP